ncbi:MAG: hypothetical protein MPJ50_00010 [Pirellulales bacterium]|nr:hypothetical protein [Pirellulales bacterium]
MSIANASGVQGAAQIAEAAAYDTIHSGELAGTLTAAQMPAVSCRLVRFKARDDNIGAIYVGGPGVTKPDGATDATTGLELNAGEDTGWIPVDNLNRCWRICDNAGDDLTYLALE